MDNFGRTIALAVLLLIAGSNQAVAQKTEGFGGVQLSLMELDGAIHLLGGLQGGLIMNFWEVSVFGEHTVQPFTWMRDRDEQRYHLTVAGLRLAYRQPIQEGFHAAFGASGGAAIWNRRSDERPSGSPASATAPMLAPRAGLLLRLGGFLELGLHAEFRFVLGQSPDDLPPPRSVNSLATSLCLRFGWFEPK